MTDAESFETGYLDKLSRNVNRGMLDSDESGAAAYRAGVRTCRADLEARKQKEEEETTDHSGRMQASDYAVPDWERRLGEFWAKLHPVAVAPALTVAEWAEDPNSGAPVALNPEPTPWGKTMIDRALADPEPGSKKPRKAKPVDDSQGSFFA